MRNEARKLTFAKMSAHKAHSQMASHECLASKQATDQPDGSNAYGMI